MGHHIGRHWPNAYIAEGRGASDHPTIEAECPCPREPCGLIEESKVHPDCNQHKMNKTIRSSHDSEKCPGHPEGGTPNVG